MYDEWPHVLGSSIWAHYQLVFTANVASSRLLSVTSPNAWFLSGQGTLNRLFAAHVLVLPLITAILMLTDGANPGCTGRLPSLLAQNGDRPKGIGCGVLGCISIITVLVVYSALCFFVGRAVP